MKTHRQADRRHGWTLLEIMVVVMIIGVLLAIAIPAFLKIRREARINEAKARVEILAAAVRQLAWDTGNWPGAMVRNEGHNPELWDLSGDDAGLLGNDGSFPDWKGPYIEDVDLDPWGQPYFFDPDYRHDGRMRVAVGSFGPNRVGRNRYDNDNIYVLLDD